MTDRKQKRTALTHALSGRTGTAIPTTTHAAGRQVVTREPILPDKEGFRRSIVLGEVANLGIISVQPRTPVLTDATKFAFADEEDPATPDRR